MPMLANPSTKYAPYDAVPFPPNYVRQWPTQRTTVAPTWLSTDLRDGNQALVNPMSNETKLELFRLLVKIGFKEIEVAYPAASDSEFNFVRSLIENNEVPDDVSLQIITPARPDLIARSVASLAGAKKAIIHLYNATSPVFRDVVFRNSRAQTVELTLAAVRAVRKLTEETTAAHGGHFRLNYCFETFSQTEPEFAVELGNRVLEAWGKAGPGDDRVAFNLAATVECAPSNHYADMVEYFSNNINQRENVILSIHPHNDRGTGVAAAELGLLAGGSRVEGCLLGNGERTGNVDLITLALNMYSQGVAPHLDFSELQSVVAVVERCNEMTVPPRYPYAGELVFSAFAGTHQDAIKKGFDAQDRRWAQAAAQGDDKRIWSIPYIPVDPADLGYGYENLIRVSSQSGKAGAAYVVKRALQLDLPRRMQVALYDVVQAESDRSGKEMTVDRVVETFGRAFFFAKGVGAAQPGRLQLGAFKLFHVSSEPSSPLSECSDESVNVPDADAQQNVVRFEGELLVDGQTYPVQGDGQGAINALWEALRTHLDIQLDVKEVATHAISSDFGSPSQPATVPSEKIIETASFVEIEYASRVAKPSQWGVGISSDVVVSKCRALLSAVNGVVGDRVFPKPKMVFQLRPMPREQSGLENLDGFSMRTGRAVDENEDWESRRIQEVETSTSAIA